MINSISILHVLCNYEEVGSGIQLLGWQHRWPSISLSKKPQPQLSSEVSDDRCIIVLQISKSMIITFCSVRNSFTDILGMTVCKMRPKNDNCRVRGTINRLFSYGNFYWENTQETLIPFEIISSGCNALVVPLQQPLESLLYERVNDLRHRLFYLLSCLITTACYLKE